MEKTAEKLKVNESLLKTVLCSATFWGLLAHGMVLFNKYSFHDDARYFNDVGATYESGRWMLGILGSLSANLLGSKNYSLPVVNGTITILCIAAIVYLLADSLRIQSKPLVILLCGSMVTFPSAVSPATSPPAGCTGQNSIECLFAQKRPLRRILHKYRR